GAAARRRRPADGQHRQGRPRDAARPAARRRGCAVLTAADGIDVAWFEVGRGEPVVLVHGLGDDHRAWRRVVAPLMLHRRVLLYDFRGHGGSGLGAADGSLQQLGDDLIALLDALAVDRATIAGFSLGGTIAMRAALDHPERIAAL